MQQQLTCLSMGYYHILLDEEASKLSTTILPWGKFQYLRLPMGIKKSPDIFQAIMMDLLGDLEYARTYIDDILIITSGSYDDHMKQIEEVLSRLEKAGFGANIRKCFFAGHEASSNTLDIGSHTMEFNHNQRKWKRSSVLSPQRTNIS